jgi:hypothetical protein
MAEPEDGVRASSHREWAVGMDGKRFSYIVLENPSPPFLIRPETITRVVGPHRPCGGRCPCCNDPFTTGTSVWVEHTTWGEPHVSSVCSSCAADPFWRRKELAAVREAREEIVAARPSRNVSEPLRKLGEAERALEGEFAF